MYVCDFLVKTTIPLVVFPFVIGLCVTCVSNWSISCNFILSAPVIDNFFINMVSIAV